MLQGCALRLARLCFTFDESKTKVQKKIGADLVYHWRHYGNADLSEHAQCSIKQSGLEQSHILNHPKAVRNACAACSAVYNKFGGLAMP